MYVCPPIFQGISSKISMEQSLINVPVHVGNIPDWLFVIHYAA